MEARVAGEGGKTVVLGVTGCIAAYKACEIVRALTRTDARVKVIMTKAATRFVGPLTFRTLTGEPVVTSLWDETTASRVFHVSLADEADVFAVAPCTANVLARLAHGLADDMLTTAALATDAPLVLAPAMNTRMWRSEATQANLSALRGRGAIVIEPASGELACGDAGEGRLAEVSGIVAAIAAELARARDLVGVRLLVTAG
ncbi:MAG TPA: bifunctional phosphopantothenoylcysteine decarboxylase/phosphopantothenate--cysteine ligase CoaBC, partial [Coriobacteriia bacterium]|nr:bifunctional phosphopantothenoylcysteine decarboxylase/phosphopantothenate--cysteine ligase CoaBC [Coriobacteriia bacterium]